MTKYKKTIATLNQAELVAESTKLRQAIAKAGLDKLNGKAKNVRQGFILRKHLATLLVKINTTV